MKRKDEEDEEKHLDSKLLHKCFLFFFLFFFKQKQKQNLKSYTYNRGLLHLNKPFQLHVHRATNSYSLFRLHSAKQWLSSDAKNKLT